MTGNIYVTASTLTRIEDYLLPAAARCWTWDDLPNPGHLMVILIPIVVDLLYAKSSNGRAQLKVA